MVGVVFITSGWNRLKDPATRSKSIGMSKAFTIFLGAADVAGAWASCSASCPSCLRAGLS
jgi:putative oxidoreductase